MVLENKMSNKEQIEVIFSNLKDSTREFLATRAAKCLDEGIKCNEIFRVGKPLEAIIKYANKEDL